MAHHPHSTYAQKWVHYIKKLRFFIVAFWLGVCICGCVWGLKFLDITVSDFPAPEGRYVCVCMCVCVCVCMCIKWGLRELGRGVCERESGCLHIVLIDE
jgi:hypothetical protein